MTLRFVPVETPPGCTGPSPSRCAQRPARRPGSGPVGLHLRTRHTARSDTGRRCAGASTSTHASPAVCHQHVTSRAVPGQRRRRRERLRGMAVSSLLVHKPCPRPRPRRPLRSDRQTLPGPRGDTAWPLHGAGRHRDHAACCLPWRSLRVMHYPHAISLTFFAPRQQASLHGDKDDEGPRPRALSANASRGGVGPAVRNATGRGAPTAWPPRPWPREADARGARGLGWLPHDHRSESRRQDTVSAHGHSCLLAGHCRITERAGGA